MKFVTDRLSVEIAGAERLSGAALQAMSETIQTVKLLGNKRKPQEMQRLLTVQILTSIEEVRALGACDVELARPTSGLLARLPVTRHVRVLTEPGLGLGWRRLDWGDTSAILWRKSSDCIYLLVPDAAHDTLWMLRYFWLNLAAAVGEISVAHASLVKFENHYVMVTAGTGGGKTTAGLCCYSLGGSLLVDDICYIASDWRCATRPIRSFINVRPNTARLFPGMTGINPPISEPSSLASERAAQVPVDIARFRRESLSEVPLVAKVDIVLHLVARTESPATVAYISASEMRNILCESLPSEPIGWVFDAMSGATPYVRDCGVPPIDVRCASGSWTVSDREGLAKVLRAVSAGGRAVRSDQYYE